METHQGLQLMKNKKKHPEGHGNAGEI